MMADLRPAMPMPRSKSPTWRAFVACGLAAAIAGGPRLLDFPLTGWEGLTIHVLAGLALFAGLLVMVEAAAIQKIQVLRASRREQLDDLARSALYNEQIKEILEEVVGSDVARRNYGAQRVAERWLESAATRASAALDSSVRLYLVESTISQHLVVARAGNEPFPIEVGKSCSADSSLAEIAEIRAKFNLIAPVPGRPSQTSLVMLCERQLSAVDRTFVEQMALLVSLLESPKRIHGAPRVGGHQHLRVV
jgi:hypothetical protein